MGWYVNTYIYQFLAAFPQVAAEVQPYEPVLNGTVVKENHPSFAKLRI
jgi:hypothetical protein